MIGILGKVLFICALKSIKVRKSRKSFCSGELTEILVIENDSTFFRIVADSCWR